MTAEILTTLTILLITVILLFSEKLRVDLVALLVLSSLALTGLVSPSEALSGFSNPAVITVWAVFVLSGGLSKTGVANLAGRLMLRLGGTGEVRLLVVIMTFAGVLSAFMNNVGVAALLLPVVMNISQRTGRAPSKLLMPLAFGSLLGGLTTLIGTPPNILASDALRDFGLQPFSLFDFTPVGVIVMASGILFMALVGRHLLPERNVRRELVDRQGASLRSAFDLQERLFILHLPPRSGLTGRSLAESRIGSTTGLNVIGIIRNGHTHLSPDADTRLQDNDRLLVAGRSDRFNDLREGNLAYKIDEHIAIENLISEHVKLVEARLPENSQYVGRTLQEIGFRNLYEANVLAILRSNEPVTFNLGNTLLIPDDVLVIQALDAQVSLMENSPDLVVQTVGYSNTHRLHDVLFTVTIPDSSILAGKTLLESRLGETYSMNVVGILRNGETILIPPPGAMLQAGDTLLVEGRREDLELIRSLQGLAMEQDEDLELEDIESDRVGLVETVLSPQTTLVGRTLREIHFREKYGLNVLAIWRQGHAYRSNLRDMAIRFGDALLIHGRRERIKVLAREPDFLVLAYEDQEAVRLDRAPIAGLIMIAVVLSVLLGWLPIAIAAVIGSSLMVLTGCLSMEDAYRFIEWRAVFLIAGMLPLGIAMENTGAASYLAGGVVNALGSFGPMALIAGLFVLTAVASQFMPNPVVTVLMAPVAVNTALSLGLSPYTLMMAVAISASSSFLSPVGHPANVLIMGPGGYRFSDYFKIGLPLTLVVLAITLLALPIFWPL